jgi:hypothetical protein
MSTNTCDIFWGSHGCDLPEGHDGQHMCGDDCTYNISNVAEHKALHDSAGPNDRHPDGCVGTWPYYGRGTMSPGGEHEMYFWRYGDNKHIDMPEEFERLAALHEKEISGGV